MPAISIIMPSFNSERFLQQAIDSALNQEFADFELIIVDDCSSDGSTAIALAAAASDRRVRVIRLERNSGGPSVPRNHAIKISSGLFISFLDSDDLDHPRKLARAMSIFEQYPETDIVFGDVIGMSEDGVPAARSTHDRPSYSFVADAASYLTHLGNNTYQCSPRYIGFMASRTAGLSTQSVVVRRGTLQRLEYIFSESLRQNEDLELWFRMAENACMKYVHEPVAYYRHVASSLTSDVRATSRQALQVHSQNYARLRDRLTDEERRRYRRRIAELLIELAWLYRSDPVTSRRFYADSLRYRVTRNALLGCVISTTRQLRERSARWSERRRT